MGSTSLDLVYAISEYFYANNQHSGTAKTEKAILGNRNGIALLRNGLVTALHLSTLEGQTTAPTGRSQITIVPSFYSEAKKREIQTNQEKH